MSGLLHHFLACLLVLSLMAGGMPAQAMHAPAPHEPPAAMQHGAGMPDCHSQAADPGDGQHDPAGHGDSCCDRHGPDHDGACGLSCACPLVAVAALPSMPHSAGAASHGVRIVASARGDPGRSPLPPRRPPIA